MRTCRLILSYVLVQVPFLHLAAYVHIMAELALVPLVTVPRFEERTQHRLRIDAEWHFLCLDRLEEGCLLFLALLFLQLSLISHRFLFLLIQGRARLARQSLLGLNSLDLFLYSRRFVFLLQASSSAVYDSHGKI